MTPFRVVQRSWSEPRKMWHQGTAVAVVNDAILIAWDADADGEKSLTWQDAGDIEWVEPANDWPQP